jgi:predicted DNA-binding transcriptional regulator YafY
MTRSPASGTCSAPWRPRGRGLRCKFDKTTTAWVKDRTWHPSQETTLEKSGRLRMTLTVAATPELVGWILNFGGGVTILKPPDLKAAVRTAAEQILTRT